MAFTGYPPYPPCFGGHCLGRQCCSRGFKFEWPNLVGVDVEGAKATIEKDNPLVTVVFVAEGEPTLDDFCCNRVYVHLDQNHKVESTPVVG